jgi:hypothetical protein
VRSEGRAYFVGTLRHQHAERHGRLLERSAAHEGEIILDQIVHAREVRFDLRQRQGNRRRTVGGRLAQLLLQQLDMQHDHPERIAEFMREAGREAAEEGKMGDPLGVTFQPLALGDCLLELPLGLLADRAVLHREEDKLDIIEAAGVQQHRARANPLEGLRHLIVIEDRIVWQ